jgi:hypothetical protein
VTFAVVELFPPRAGRKAAAMTNIQQENNNTVAEYNY